MAAPVIGHVGTVTTPERPGAARRVARFALPLGFVVAALFGLVVALPIVATTKGFNHRYAKLPSSAGQVPFGKSIEPVPSSDLLLGVNVTSLGLLVEALPPGYVTRTGQTWTIHHPILVANGGSLEATSAATIVFAPGAFLEVGPGGSATLSDVVVEGTPSPSDRGFLLDVAGRLTVRHSILRDLGRLSTLTTGLTFEAASPGSGVVDSTITGNTVGVYVTDSSGFSITGSRVTSSKADGIELHADVSRALVADDLVTASGMNDVELSAGVTHTTIENNTLGSAVEHGIVLYNAVNGDVISHNSVAGTFDGVVVSYASSNALTGNRITGARRAGIHLAGGAADNIFRGNTITSCPVAVFADGGASGNRVLDSVFANNGENVRFRRTAPDNVVAPRPTQSELRSS